MNSDEITIIVVVCFYFAVAILIGLHYYKKSESISDYILGGRSLNPYVTALSAQASDMSGWLLMGLPGSIYLAGMGKLWLGIGLCIGSYFSWIIIAKRLRIYTERSGDSLTLSEFFSNRFRDDNRGINLRNVSAVIILVFFTIYVTSGFVGAGNVFRMIIPDIDYVPAMLIGAVVVIAYTSLGGFKAVSWTDVIQGMLMVFAVVFVALVALDELGGWSDMSRTLEGMTNVPDHFLDIFYSGGEPITAVVLISCLVWGLGYFGMPHVIVRYTAIRDPDDLRISRRVGVVWTAVCLLFTTLMAIFGRAYFGETLLENPENVFIELAGDLLPAAIAAIVYSALLAAIMSTADSQLLVASSAVCNDLYRSFTKEEISERKLMNLARLVVVLIATIGAVLALDSDGAIMQLVSYAWAGFGAAFGPAVLLSLLWRRTTGRGVFAGMVIGFATVILWNTFLVAGGIIAGGGWCIYDTGLYELAPAFLFSFVATVLVSLADKEPSEEIAAEFDKVQEACRRKPVSSHRPFAKRR